MNYIETRRVKSKSQYQRPTYQKDIINVSDMIQYWGDKDDFKLPPINVVEKEDFYNYQPFEIKYKLYQNCFFYNNAVHKEFEIKYISKPEEMEDSDIQIEYKVFITNCYQGRPSLTKTDYKPQISYYSGVIEKTTNCLFQIEYIPEHLIPSSKTIRGIFYHYYFNYRYENLPLLEVYKTPIMFKPKQIMKFQIMAPKISDSLQNGLITIVYITEKYVPLRNLFQKKLESGKYSYDEKLFIVLKIMDIIERLENAGMAILDLNLDNILITQDNKFKLSAITVIPYIPLSQYKENYQMYDNFEQVMNYYIEYRTKALQTPEFRRKEPIIDYRQVTRYQLGLIIFQLYFDIKAIQFYDDTKIQQQLFDLRKQASESKPHTPSIHSQNGVPQSIHSQNQQSKQSEQSLQQIKNPLQFLILELMNQQAEKRTEKSLTELINLCYVADEFQFTEFEDFYKQEGEPMKSYSSWHQVNQAIQKSNIFDKSIQQQSQVSQIVSKSDSKYPAIEVTTPIQEPKKQSRRGENFINYIRQKNLIAEIHFNIFLYSQALDQWQYLLPDIEEGFGQEVEYEYCVERIWTLAQYLKETRVLDQISDKFLRMKKSTASNAKEHNQLAILFKNQAQLKQQIEKYTDAIDLYKQSIREYQKAKGKYCNEIAHTMTLVGILYHQIKEFEKARMYFEQAVQNFCKIDKQSIITMMLGFQFDHEEPTDKIEKIEKMSFWHSLYHLAKFNFEQSNLGKAQMIFQACLEIYQQIKNEKQLFEEFINKYYDNIIDQFRIQALIFLKDKDYSDALELVNEGISINKEDFKAKPLIDIKVDILIKQNKISEALSLIGLWARKFQRSHNLSLETGILLKQVADLAFQFNEYNVAFSFYSEALTIFKNKNAKGLKSRAEYAKLSEIVEEKIRQLFLKYN